MTATLDRRTAGETALPVCLDAENPNRLVSLWWAMQHSDQGSRQAAVITCYLDEGGTHDSAPVAVVGGLLLDKSGFLGLDGEWTEILQKHEIPPPLHMKDFRRPDGRLADISDERRRALFVDATAAINKHKVYSVASTLTTADYRKYFGAPHLKQTMGFYGICFMLALRLNYEIAAANQYTGRIPLLLDGGNEYAGQVREAHAVSQEIDFPNAGSLTFDDDRLVNALQAADVITWASRVRAMGEPFSAAYEPLSGLFDPAHEERRFPEDMIAKLADSLLKLW